MLGEEPTLKEKLDHIWNAKRIKNFVRKAKYDIGDLKRAHYDIIERKAKELKMAAEALDTLETRGGSSHQGIA